VQRVRYIEGVNPLFPLKHFAVRWANLGACHYQ